MTVYDTRQAAVEIEKELQEHSREKLLGFSRKREPIGHAMTSRSILTPLAGGKEGWGMVEDRRTVIRELYGSSVGK